jgi:hypothetical protein
MSDPQTARVSIGQSDMPNVEAVHRAICRESCAFRGEPPCWAIEGDWPNTDCDEPGCWSLAMAAVFAIKGVANVSNG